MVQTCRNINVHVVNTDIYIYIQIYVETHMNVNGLHEKADPSMSTV